MFIAADATRSLAGKKSQGGTDSQGGTTSQNGGSHLAPDYIDPNKAV